MNTCAEGTSRAAERLQHTVRSIRGGRENKPSFIPLVEATSCRRIHMQTFCRCTRTGIQSPLTWVQQRVPSIFRLEGPQLPHSWPWNFPSAAWRFSAVNPVSAHARAARICNQRRHGPAVLRDRCKRSMRPQLLLQLPFPRAAGPFRSGGDVEERRRFRNDCRCRRSTRYNPAAGAT